MIVCHFDLDSFFAACEILEQPELAGKPLVVGGDPAGRGVVATASYEARRFGVHSGQSAATARRLCPQAVFLRPRSELYRDYSKRVFVIVGRYAKRIEQLGLDEAYIELADELADEPGPEPGAESERIASEPQEQHTTDEASDPVVSRPGLPERWLRARERALELQRAIMNETGLGVSLGLASSKTVAKIASDALKPRGFLCVPPGREAEFLAPLEVRKLPGVGPNTQARLARIGVTRVGELAALSDERLARTLPGVVGRVLRDRARGHDPRELDVVRERKQLGCEQTFPTDIEGDERIASELRVLADELAGMLAQRGFAAKTVTVKLRYPDFTTRTRSVTVPIAVYEAPRIHGLALGALRRALGERDEPLRLLGISARGFTTQRQPELLEAAWQE